jgi:hypothetical protein
MRVAKNELRHPARRLAPKVRPCKVLAPPRAAGPRGTSRRVGVGGGVCARRRCGRGGRHLGLDCARSRVVSGLQAGSSKRHITSLL